MHSQSSLPPAHLAILPPAPLESAVSIPRAAKPLVRESQIEAAETLADVSMVVNVAQASLGGATRAQVIALESARARFRRSEKATEPPMRSTVRPLRERAR